MGNKFLFLFLTLIIAFIKAPKPGNIQIFNIYNYTSSINKEYYEINVLKNEIFGLEFERGRGTNCYWKHSNDTYLKESNYVRFLNSSTWDYLTEEYEKKLEEIKKSTSAIQSEIEPAQGGTEYYYELFKALDGGNQSQPLYFTYSCGNDIAQKVTVDIWICDEISKDEKEKCVIKKLCSNALTEEECTSAKATNPTISKCVFDKSQKICKEEKKLCYEIKDGATKDICSNVQVSEANKTCAFDKEENSCTEVNIANDGSKNKSFYFIAAFLSVFAIISIILSRILI